MRNRAKCKLCEDVIESKHRHDYITCSCGEISVDGGNDYMHARFNNPENFICIDDEGNEIIPKMKEEKEESPSQTENARPLLKVPRDELLDILDEMVKRIGNLPQHASLAPITHADFASLLMLLSSIFRSD